jgi:NADP-dependent 3-hydroxy acid dehydrogenase YdfG
MTQVVAQAVGEFDEPLERQVVVITGACSPIGSDVVRHLCGKSELLCQGILTAMPKLGPHGYNITIVAPRKDLLDALAEECGGTEHIQVIVADVTMSADRVVALALERWGRIDCWINNTSRTLTKMVSALEDEDIDLMMRVNVKSALHGMQAALPALKKNENGGQIINVSSILGRDASVAPLRSAYSGSKHFLNSLTDALRAELAADFPKIVITSISPSSVAPDVGLNAGDVRTHQGLGVQAACEVAVVIARAMEERGTEYYTTHTLKPFVDAFIARKGA